MNDITFQSFDKFERSGFADRLTTVIKKFSPFYDEAFVLSLNAKFGSGKTTFLKMWKNKLESEGNQVIYINAWETDFDDEPIIPIVSAILSDVSETTLGSKVKEAMITALGATALAANSLVDEVTGINVKDIAEAVEKDQKLKSIELLGNDLYAEYSYKKRAFEELRTKLFDFANDLESRPLVIFVDELDRVRPDYAVRFLEAIKHLFSVKGIVFVLAVDRGQLEVSIRQLYGDIDFENYYRRFITREANLPDVHKIQVLPFLQELSKNFFDEKRAEGVNFSFEINQQATLLEFIAGLCKAYKFLPREIESYFRIFSQFMLIYSPHKIERYSPHKIERYANYSWVTAASALVAIYIKDQPLYHRIGRQEAMPEEILQHLNSLEFYSGGEIGLKKNDYMRLLYGAYLNNNEDNNIAILDLCLKEIEGIDNIFETDNAKDLRRQMFLNLSSIFYRRELYSTSCIAYCYQCLEDWAEFIAD